MYRSVGSRRWDSVATQPSHSALPNTATAHQERRSGVLARMFHVGRGQVRYSPMVDAGSAAASASPPPRTPSSGSTASPSAPPHVSTSSEDTSSRPGSESRLSRLLRETTGRSESGLMQRLRPHTITVLMACVAWALAVRNLRDKTRWRERHEQLEQDVLVLQDRLDEAAALHAQIHATLTALPPSQAPLRQRALDQSLLLQHLLMSHQSSSSHSDVTHDASTTPASAPVAASPAPKTKHTTLFAHM